MPVPAPVKGPTGAEPWRDYELAAQVGTVEGWDEFLRVYNTGYYANLARAQRAKLMAAATPTPPVPALVTTLATPASPPAPAAPGEQPKAPAELASFPPQSATTPRTRTLQPETARSRKRDVERKHAQAAAPTRGAAVAEGGGAKNNSIFCGYVRQHLGTAIAFGLDNRDGAISAAKRACR
jgi:hypothetical protein